MKNYSEILCKKFIKKIIQLKWGGRTKRNLDLETKDVIEWCKKKILNKRGSIIRKGKNRSVSIDDIIITVNAYSYTIITAHKQKTL